MGQSWDQDLKNNPDISKPYGHIAVVGAGAWGTALALVAARAGRNVTLWSREPEVTNSILTMSENAIFLPGVPLPNNIVGTANIMEAACAEAVLLAAPAQHIRAVRASEPIAVR